MADLEKDQNYAPKSLPFPRSCPAVPLSPTEAERRTSSSLIYSEKYAGLTDAEKCAQFPELAAAETARAQVRKQFGAQALRVIRTKDSYKQLPDEMKEMVAEILLTGVSSEVIRTAEERLRFLNSSGFAKLCQASGPESMRAVTNFIFRNEDGLKTASQLERLLPTLRQDENFQTLGSAQKDLYLAKLIPRLAESAQQSARLKAISADSKFHLLNDKIKSALVEGSADITTSGAGWEKLLAERNPERDQAVAALLKLDVSRLSQKHVNELVGIVGESSFKSPIGEKNQGLGALHYISQLLNSPGFHTLSDDKKSRLLELAQLPVYEVAGTKYATREAFLKIITSQGFAQLTYNEKEQVFTQFDAIRVTCQPGTSRVSSSLNAATGDQFAENLHAVSRSLSQLSANDQEAQIRQLLVESSPRIDNPRFHTGNVESTDFLVGERHPSRSVSREYVGTLPADPHQLKRQLVEYSLEFGDGQVLRVHAPKSERATTGEALPRLYQMISAIESLPPELRQNINDIYLNPFTSGSNQRLTLMSAGDGVVNVFQAPWENRYSQNGEEKLSLYGSLLHEAGHLVTIQGRKLTLTHDQQVRYLQAIEQDPGNVSGYAVEGEYIEDLAETIAMYYAAKSNPNPSVMRSIRAMYPRRIAVIEELVETERTKLQARNSVGR